ncbi:MAG: hypothetical protein IPM85_14755 [Chitinophagaceae bacterium]|nr:hypothetical protein [Chitinophagaceae bacterium]
MTLSILYFFLNQSYRFTRIVFSVYSAISNLGKQMRNSYNIRAVYSGDLCATITETEWQDENTPMNKAGSVTFIKTVNNLICKATMNKVIA